MLATCSFRNETYEETVEKSIISFTLHDHRHTVRSSSSSGMVQTYIHSNKILPETPYSCHWLLGFLEIFMGQ